MSRERADAGDRAVRPPEPVDLGATAAYDYRLPAGRIARYPVEERDQSRLLAVPRGGPPFRDLVFSDLPSLLRPGDLLVLNESRVMPVRLIGHKPTGAECEILLLRPAGAQSGEADPSTHESHAESPRWEALVRPGGKLKPGRRVVISEDFEVLIEESLPGGERLVRLESSGPVALALERFGRVPLPPYLEREEEPLDRTRYQTVYAANPGSVAAPTAGLHFTGELLNRLVETGVRVAKVTLHVGPGTFRPVDSDRIADHRMHREHWYVPREAAREVAEARTRGGRVWAVGTTVVRTLESAASTGGEITAGDGETDLFILPGYQIRTVDGLITNFHLPRSTLLMLVAAFAGYRNTMEAYAHAIERGYRFYSYGDAMVVTP